MQYETLDEFQPLQITYEGPILDAITLGVLYVQLQEITDKVAYSLLAREDLFDRHVGIRPRRLYFLDEDRIVKARVDRIQSGSLQESVTFAF